MTKPLVSIGIPCYNNAGSLRKAIDSALAQTWPETEVIVVDDGSTDTSLVIAGAFGDRITLYRSGHRGANYARNLVLREAKGAWVQFLDADDYLEPDKITRQLEEAEGGENADVLYSPVWVEKVTADRVERTRGALDEKRDLWLQWLSWELPQTGGALWRREALDELGGWRNDQPCCQEHELYLRALQAGLRFQHTPSPGAVYRLWSEQTLCRKDPRLVVRTKTKLIDNCRDWLVARKYWTSAHTAVAGRACFEMARTLARENVREAAAYYRERRKRRLLRLSGPAAPPAYRLLFHLLGFSLTERLARQLR
jgi:GT2 family glycosyltransferase